MNKALNNVIFFVIVWICSFFLIYTIFIDNSFAINGAVSFFGWLFNSLSAKICILIFYLLFVFCFCRFFFNKRKSAKEENDDSLALVYMFSMIFGIVVSAPVAIWFSYSFFAY